MELRGRHIRNLGTDWRKMEKDGETEKVPENVGPKEGVMLVPGILYIP